MSKSSVKPPKKVVKKAPAKVAQAPRPAAKAAKPSVKSAAKPAPKAGAKASAKAPAKAPAKAMYREASMRSFFPNALVDGYQPLTGKMPNHPKDRHVLAAALTCKADYLVTFNLRDFPSAPVESTAIIGPSTFLKALWQLAPQGVKERLQEQADAIGFELGY